MFLGGELLDPVVAMVFSKVAVLVYISPRNVWEFQCLYILIDKIVVCPFVSSSYGGYAVVPHCFDYNFPAIMMLSIFTCAYCPFMCLL
jgi:hypothetical protein